MWELPLILLGGLLGSAHCIGMCGPFALLIGGQSRSFSHNLSRQLAYSGGRIFTYGAAGACAGFAGLWLTAHASPMVSLQGWLGVAAGLLLVLVGLGSAGWLHLPDGAWTAGICHAARGLKTLLMLPGRRHAFLAGVFSGFLPCGLVYAFLAQAASRQSVWLGALTMAAFGMGTVPLLVATGCGGGWLSVSSRTRWLKLAAWCVVATGVISLARGATTLTSDEEAPTPACPFCEAGEAR